MFERTNKISKTFQKKLFNKKTINSKYEGTQLRHNKLLLI